MKQLEAECRKRLSYIVNHALGRWLIAGIMFVTGLGRVGLLGGRAMITEIPEMIYGSMFLSGALGLAYTGYRLRNRYSGRIVAGLCACVLAGFGVDILVGNGSSTSAWIMLWLEHGAAIEALAEHDI